MIDLPAGLIAVVCHVLMGICSTPYEVLTHTGVSYIICNEKYNGICPALHRGMHTVCACGVRLVVIHAWFG